MAKRRPGSELNDRNWDVEEEPEEVSFYFTYTVISCYTAQLRTPSMLAVDNLAL